ncbi:TetR/AcrR family transcriptional regulator [Dietzia sp.]|uniref:TetR/AcrR family transcriptional regulator n=1 Tax=Dietzia sp. TaxID=1871616 RepID=UPI002FD8A2AB
MGATEQGRKPEQKLGKRAAARAETMRRITELGLEQLDAEGVAGLSLREVARELGLVSSAVYRYVASRDDLLTLLLVDCFTSLAEAALGGDDGGAGRPPRRRYIAVAGRIRAWAVERPERWTLLYGSPVRGYAAPGEETTGPGTRVIALFAEIVAGSGAAGSGAADREAEGGAVRRIELTDAARDVLGWAARDLEPSEPTPEELAVAATLFAGTVGVVTAEVFGQWGPLPADGAAAIFEAQTRALSLLLPRE